MIISMPDPYSSGLGAIQPQAAAPQDVNRARMLKIYAAMGLDPTSPTADQVFEEITRVRPEQLQQGLGEWENANPIMNMLGRGAAKKMLNQENLNKYLQKASEIRTRREGFLPAAEAQYPGISAKYSPLIEQMRSVENKLSDPAALQRLNAWFQQIKRPSDIDKIPVESVTSRITP